MLTFESQDEMSNFFFNKLVLEKKFDNTNDFLHGTLGLLTDLVDRSWSRFKHGCNMLHKGWFTREFLSENLLKPEISR